MRLYSTDGATHVDHALGSFDADENGAFDLPDEVSAGLHPFNGWEDDVERDARLFAEELARRADPATLLAELEKVTASLTPAPAPAPRKRAAAKPSA